MNIVCIPVADDQGLRAPVAARLDSAPVLLLVDTATLAHRAIPNEEQRRRTRGCDPCAPLDDTAVDAIIVASIDPPTHARVARRGVAVFSGASGTAMDALSAFIAGRLPLLAPARER